MDRYEQLTTMNGNEDEKLKADFNQSPTVSPDGVEGEQAVPPL